MSDQIENPTLEGIENPEEALAPPGEQGLTNEQLAARVALRREQAEQDAGWVVPPGMGEDVEPLPEAEVAEPPVAPPEEPEEEIPAEEEVEPEEEPTEPEPEEPEEPEEEVEEEEFYVGRYKTREAAEAALAEKDRVIDSLFRDRHEREQQPEPEEEAELDVNAWHQWAQESVEQGGSDRAALQALERGGSEGYDIYLSHWLASDDPEQVAAAHAFNNEVQRQFAAQRALQAVSPLLAEQQQRSTEADAAAAKQYVSDQYDDFGELEQTMDNLIREDGALPAETKQRLTQMAQSGYEGKVHAWEFLYQAASAVKGKSRTRARSVEASRRKQDSDRAKIAATVSSSEATQTRTSRTATELAVIRKKNAIREKLGQPLLPED
jgi:hypothetical protein